MKHVIASALCAVGLMAAVPAAAGIIKVITEEGEVMYFDTSTGQTQGSAAKAASSSRGAEDSKRTPMRASGADSTIGFFVPPPSPPPSASGGSGRKCAVAYGLKSSDCRN